MFIQIKIIKNLNGETKTNSCIFNLFCIEKLRVNHVSRTTMPVNKKWELHKLGISLRWMF